MRAPSVIGITTLGTLLEWAEYSFYGYMATTFAVLFFPENAPHIGLLKTFGIFAIGYIVRPLGAIFFGYIGDRLGRKPALVASLGLMGGTTFCIGCLPTYATWGIAAPCLLLLLRILQGIAVSGEYNGAGIFLIEKLGKHAPCFAGSWVSASAAAGMVLGGIAALLVSLSPLWAWRLPFLLGGLSCFLGLKLRKQVTESRQFLKQSQQTTPLLKVLQNHKKSLLVTMIISAFTGIYFYIGNVYMLAFLKTQLSLPSHHATLFVLLAEGIVMVLIPLIGYLADQKSPYAFYQAGLLSAILVAPCLFLLVKSGHYLLITLAMLLFGISHALTCGPTMKILYDQFPAHLRYTGISVGWSLAAAIFSGSAPLLAQYLTIWLKWPLAPSLYICTMAFCFYLITKQLFPKSATPKVGTLKKAMI